MRWIAYIFTIEGVYKIFGQIWGATCPSENEEEFI